MRTREKIEQLIDGLGYDFSRFMIPNFIAHLSQSIGRKIFLIPCAMPEGTFGAWLTDNELPLEYLIIDQGISGQHAIHVQLHELGHMMMRHQTGRITSHLLQALIAGKDDTVLQQALHRRPSRQDDEQEAELFAVIIQERLMQVARIHYLETSSSSDTLQQYFSDLGM